jgi:lysophospholipase L1-like esterase
LAAAVGWSKRSHLEVWLAMQWPGSNPEHALIAMLGDSHIASVNWRLLLHCDGIGNYGKSGDTTAQMVARLPHILELKPKLLMIMGGTNDAVLDIAPQETIANLKAIKDIADRSGVEYISFSPPPLPIKADVLAPIRATASISIPFDKGDLLSDHIHLKLSGYAKWRDAAMQAVLKYCS